MSAAKVSNNAAHPASKEKGCETYPKGERDVIPEHRVILYNIKLKSFTGYRNSLPRFLSRGLVSTGHSERTKT